METSVSLLERLARAPTEDGRRLPVARPGKLILFRRPSW